MATATGGGGGDPSGHRHPSSLRGTGIQDSPARLAGSPAHRGTGAEGFSAPPTEVSVSVASSWLGNGVGKVEGEVNYPTSAVEILDLLRERVAILSGGRDKQGQSIITFPAQAKNFGYQRENIRRVVQYLACIPAVDVRELGFSVIIDARNSTWASSKIILRTLQEALPGQIHVAYIVQPGQFWQKQQSKRGHNKEKGKLEFSTIKLSAVEKLSRHVDSSQLTSDLGGFLPYNHEQWLSLRQDLEHFISLYNGLMEHSTHIEQQIHMEQESSESDSLEEQLKHHLPLQDMVKRAPQDAIRKGNDLLRTLERDRDESGTSMTPDKINAVAVIKQLLERITQRQAQLDELWRQRKTVLEQNMQVKSFEKSVYKVRGWLKTRGEDMVVTQADIGTSVESVQAILEHHEKSEGKARLQYNLLTQLRRSADRYSGDQHYAATTMQRQVTKLSAKFSRFETKMAARRNIIECSLRMHTSLRQWKQQCDVVATVLKQEGAGSGSEGAGSQEDLVQQLRQIGDVVLEEAGSLMELMVMAARRTSETGEEGRGSVPDYSTGMSHVKRLTEEVENHRRRLGQLAEARKVQGEQLKQIDSCEKDAKQETRWLEYMLTQLSNTHGDVGDSVVAADKLITEHTKFIETAKKSYKYGCGLISAAEKGRRSFQLDSDPSSTLLSSHTSSWEKLLSGAKEVGDRLKMARHFHSLSEEVLGRFNEWLTPLHELPKTPDLVEKKLKDIATHREELFLKAKECLATGRSLCDRLGRPVLPETDFLTPNDRVKTSQVFLEAKLLELERKAVEVEEILPQQEQLLNEFITYCQFERRIEKVLLWLQGTGLKKLPTFSTLAEDKTSQQQQLHQFQEFKAEAAQLSSQVQELLSSAEGVESRITGFRSDLGKKASSLGAVWGKFLQRVENRGTVIIMAVAFCTSLEKMEKLRAELVSGLAPQVVAKRGGRVYLEGLVSTKEDFDDLIECALRDGEGLMEIFSRPPTEPHSPLERISQQLGEVEAAKKEVNKLWEKAWRPSVGVRSEPIGQSPSHSSQGQTTPSTSEDHVTSSGSGTSLEGPRGGGLARVHKIQTAEVKKVGVVNKRSSDKFSELEEEAYEYLEWLEKEYEVFIAAHNQFHENQEEALRLKQDYDKFLSKLQPTFTKVGHVVNLMSQLRSQAPPLATSIDKLCQVVSERIKTLNVILKQCSNVLESFAQFCNLYREVDCGLQALDGMLSEEGLNDLNLDMAQELLDHGVLLVEKLRREYEEAKNVGEAFLTTTSEILTSRGGPKLSVGGACTSVAVDLGDLEGRGPELLERWEEREKELRNLVDWHSFKLSYDQVCLWLRESAELFLQNHTDIGTSKETAEDLLTEHEEFQIRAQRTATEVATLLGKSEVMQASRHGRSQELRELTGQMRQLHSNFESRFAGRKKLLEATIQFYRVAAELNSDMSTAIDQCKLLTGKDLPSHLKITSISSRFSNLQHEGDQLLVSLANKPHTVKARRGSKVITRSDSTSASEVSIREELAALRRHFATYKEIFESRHLSSKASKPTAASVNKSVSPVLMETRANLKSPVQENGHSYGDKLSPEVPVEDEKSDAKSKSSSLGRRSTIGVWWTGTGRAKGPGPGGSSIDVKEKVAALNQRSKDDTLPIRELGTSFGPRQRAKSAGSSTIKKILFGDAESESREEKESAKKDREREMEVASKREKELTKKGKDIETVSKKEKDLKQPIVMRRATSDGSTASMSTNAPASVPLRRRDKGLSKAERSRKIEDIKKLFETSEIADQLGGGSADSAAGWSPREYGSKAAPPLEAVRGVVREKEEEPVISANKIELDPVFSPLPPELPKAPSEPQPPNLITSPEPPKPPTSPAPPAVVISPPPSSPATLRDRINTAPTVIRTVIKDRAPPAKKQVITINIDSAPTAKTAESANVSKTAESATEASKEQRSSPLTHRRVNSDTPPLLKGRGWREEPQKGKVSTLRDMFDPKVRHRANTASASLTTSPKHSTTSHRPNLPASAISPSSSAVAEIPGKGAGPRSQTPPIIEDRTPADDLREATPTNETTPPVEDSKKETFKEGSPPRPHLPSHSPHYTPPPRPPSPLGYYKPSNNHAPNPPVELDTASSVDSESGSSLMDESDMEWIVNQLSEWNEDIDSELSTNETDSAPTATRPLKSMRKVLSDLLTSELSYLKSLEVLVEVYLSHLVTSSHVPSFLKGAETKIFSNIRDIYNFQRQFYEELSEHEDSLEGVCNSFIHNEEGFQCYLPFLLNLEAGLSMLRLYGGSFFTDKQREVEDEPGLVAHFSKPRDRLVDYLETMRDLCYCAQKQYLHGVSLVKDVLKLLMRVLRAVDNECGIHQLRGCPHPLLDSHMICRDNFLVYSTRGKKRKVYEMCVFLHASRVVLARPRKNKQRKGEMYLEYYDSIQTAEMHLLETYKSQEEKFALCEGKLSPDNLFVFRSIYMPLLVKMVWLQEIWPVLQKRDVSRGVLVNEDEVPLPLFFRTTNRAATATYQQQEEAGPDHTPSLARRLSIRRRKREVRRSTKGSLESGSENSLEAMSRSSKRDAMIRSSYISSASSTASSLPAPPLADIQLASMSVHGEYIQQQRLSEDVYEVITDFNTPSTSPGAEFLSVRAGQLVEVLDDSEKGAWLVLTLGDESVGQQQEEGFLPPHVLRKHVGGDRETTPLQNEQFEAETGQEVPPALGEDDVDAPQPLTPDETAEGGGVCSEETTGQSLTSPPQPTSSESDMLSPSQTSQTSSSDTLASSSSTQVTDSKTSLTDDSTRPHPQATPHHADLLASGGLYVDATTGSSREPSSSPPPLPPQSERVQLPGMPLSCSLRSLPTSFSPTGTPTMATHKFLGYDPMMIPTYTMSQPNIPKIKIDPSCPPSKLPGELGQLQRATIQATSETSLEDFDPVEMCIAIADFEAAEDCNVSLRAGQCVQVLDSSRTDWWLVMSADNESQGWVPANYLEQRIIEGPISPPPDPFEDETGELATIMMKNVTASEMNLNRMELYRASFLTLPGLTSPEEPSEAQLRGMFGLTQPYLAVTEVQGDYPEQMTVLRDQPVQVLDSKRSDWWLVSSIPEGEDASGPVEGWIKPELLQPADRNIREGHAEHPVAPVRSSSGNGHPQAHPQALSRSSTVSPSLPTQWMVLADYSGTEPSMLSVSEGELVEVLETSANEWCLVRSMTRPSTEGWVPSAYLCPYGGQEGYASHTPSPRHRSYSSSEEESDTPTEISEHSAVMSPEVLEAYDDEEQRAEAEEKRMYVLSELSKTEQDYVQKLHFCLTNYDPKAIGDSAPRALRALRNSLLGNLKEIYVFHKEHLLPKLLASEQDPTQLGDAFISEEEGLRLYVAYCQNKAASDDIYHEFSSYFEDLRVELKDRQKLPDYLILPVQRITKYGLLLADFHKYSIRAGLPEGRIEEGLEVTRSISTQANNAIHLSLVEGINRSHKFGQLVLQDVFLSQDTHRQLYKERRVFLFERALLITKRRRKEESEVYTIKDQLLLHEVNMIQDMDRERRNLIVYDMVTGTKFLLRASKTPSRDLWLERSTDLIQKAKTSSDLINRARSTSEPTELAHTFNFARKSMFRRDKDGSKGKVKRPSSSTGVRPVLQGSDEMVRAGTNYVVMQCIVMEGEDDHTLEPGEVVQLVRDVAADAPLYKVRTLDENNLVGKIASSYLRRRDSFEGDSLESSPKFTMQPADLDLPVGSMAAISCAFNGYPAPSVVWKRDHETLSCDERRRILSCDTSSVLEINRLEYDDEGRYTCLVTNSKGNDATTMTLSLHGPPSEPQKPTVSKVSSTSVKLKWAVPDMDGGVPILSYQIEMWQDGFDQWQPIVQQPRTYFVVKTLEPSTSYKFRVSAVNKYGFGSPSEPTDPVVTKGKGPISASPTLKKPPPIDEVKEDSLAPEDVRDPYIRRGSVSSAYDILPEELGRGRFGIVHTCHHRQSGLQYAAKFVRLRSRKKSWVRREAEILQRVRGKSPYILEFQEAFERGRNLIIVTELVPSGELLETVVAENSLTEAVAVGYLSQLLSAVDTLHRLKIAHLDIRPENVLLSFGRIKLIDFGTALDLTLSDPAPLFASSVEFCAPEIVNQDTPTFSADMWSIGVLTYVLLSGLSPFFADNVQSMVAKIQEARYSYYKEQFDSISQEARDFISALLQKSSEYRMNASDALRHSWIKMLGGVGERVSSPWLMPKLDTSQLKSFIARRKWHTSTVAVDDTTVYGPRSMSCFSPTPPDFEELAKNEDPPRLTGSDAMVGQVGHSVTLQFEVNGSPLPSVVWEHEEMGEVKMSPRQHVVELSGGVTSLTISDLCRADEGVYTCTAVNHLGAVSATCRLTVLVVPNAPTDVNTIILGSYNSALISWLPPVADSNAPISKYLLERRRLDLDLWEVVSEEIEGAAHVIDDLLPGVTYTFRVSASNEVGTGPSSDPSEPVTIDTTQEYDSDSPTLDKIRLKSIPFALEYQEEGEIYRGKFSLVLKCREKTTDYVYAAKMLSEQLGGATWRQRALKELEVLRELAHPRVVTLEDSFDNEDRILLVTEYLAGGTLTDYVDSHGMLTDYTSTKLMRKLVDGLQYLHQCCLIHANLTPDNLLLSSGFTDLKIAGFGCARYVETGNQLTDLSACGVEFLSPEAVSLQPLTVGTDIWSLGVVSCFMLTGRSPYKRDTDEATISAITSSTANSLDFTSKPLSSLSPEAQDFVTSCLNRNPRRRLAAQQCQRHRWLLSSAGSRRSSVGQGSPVRRQGSVGSAGSSPGRRRSTGSNRRKSNSSPTRKSKLDSSQK